MFLPRPIHTQDIYDQIRGTARKFAESEIRPIAVTLDETEAYPAELYAKMAALGLLGITVPADYGGAGLDALLRARSAVTSSSMPMSASR